MIASYHKQIKNKVFFSKCSYFCLRTQAKVHAHSEPVLALLLHCLKLDCRLTWNLLLFSFFSVHYFMAIWNRRFTRNLNAYSISKILIKFESLFNYSEGTMAEIEALWPISTPCKLHFALVVELNISNARLCMRSMFLKNNKVSDWR